MPRTLTDNTLHVLLDWVCPHGLIEVSHESTHQPTIDLAAANGSVAFIATDGTIVLVTVPDDIESIRSCLADLGVAYIEPQEA